MKSIQPSPIPPWHSNFRYRQRNYNFKIDNVIGWSDFHVLLTLGWPNEIRNGEEWQTTPPSQNIIVRDGSGNMTKGFSFEPTPHRVPPLQAYQTWLYHNVRGMTWRLYITQKSPIPLLSWFLPRIVVEVYEHPTNAVF